MVLLLKVRPLLKLQQQWFYPITHESRGFEPRNAIGNYILEQLRGSKPRLSWVMGNFKSDINLNLRAIFFIKTPLTKKK